jgi:hypothetical protein
MSREIPEYLARCAFDLSGKADAQTWNAIAPPPTRSFLRGFDREILEEMRGIADGANAAGAKVAGPEARPDRHRLANTTVEWANWLPPCR